MSDSKNLVEEKLDRDLLDALRITKSDPIIAFEEKLNRSLIQSLENGIGIENIWDCIQCGTCSGACPVSGHMDHTPRKIMAMLREGFTKEVLSSSAIWLCCSCYACTVQCPKNIKITNILYALKRNAIEKKLYPRRFAIPILAQEFFRIVKMFGRSFETLLMTIVALKANPKLLFGSMGLGMKLFFTGSLTIFPEIIKNRKAVQDILSKKK